MPTSKKSKKKTSRSNGVVVLDDASLAVNQEIVAPKVKSAPTISTSVRRLVATAPQLTLSEISARLIKDGWNPEEIERRKSTIVTLRADTFAILTIVREEGWRAPNKRN